MNANTSTLQHELSSPVAHAASLPEAAKIVMRLLDGLQGGAIDLRAPGGMRSVLGSGSVVANLQVDRWDVFDRLISKGSIGFAEDFIVGAWRSDNLSGLLTLLACNRRRIEQVIHGNAFRLIGYRLRHLLSANTKTGSRRNIQSHYDLGNSFYALWLDETMSYSSALFSDQHATLAEAQEEKYRRILRRLDARAGQRILEIGCGWGGFAQVAAQEFGCHIRGLTLSPAQQSWSRARAAANGFSDRAVFDLCDYRDVHDQYDHIVSIEMLEAVGERYWPRYFAQLHNCLAPGGKAIVQVITIADDLFATYRSNVDFIQRYIFPGGMLPSPSRFGAAANRAGLRISDDHAFGQDYARTLSEWHTRFDACLPQVRAQGFDESFIRMWQFYLAYCEAGFLANSTDVHQYELVHAGSAA